MFYVNKNPILSSPMEVLIELKAQLALNGIQRFSVIKEGTKNIQCNCPIHKDGQETKPSCGITTEKTIRKTAQGETVIPEGTVHCFTCGYTATLEEMISNCFGYNDMGLFGVTWLVKNFLTVSIENRKVLELDMQRGNNATIKKYITEEELDTYRYYHPYMYERKLTNDVIELFDVGYDNHFVLKPKGGGREKVLRCLTFPVRDKNGNVLFIGRRSVNTKLFHYPEGVDKPVYGIYELPKDADEVVVCESFINGLTCYVYGKFGLALLGTGTEQQYEQLKRLPCRKIITALDPDDAGRAGTAKLKKAMQGYKIVTSYVLPEGKDINDLSKEEFDNLEEIF